MSIIHLTILVVSILLAPLFSRVALKFVLYMPSYIIFWTENKIYEMIRKPAVCNDCGHSFDRWFEIFPIVGYFIAPKCPNCDKSRSNDYLIFELSIIFLCIFSVIFFNYQIDKIIFAWFIIGICGCCFYIDLTNMLLPDLLTYSLLWVGLAGSLRHFIITPEQAILGVIVTHVALVNSNSLSKMIFKKEGLFQGDVKFLSGVAAIFGMVNTFYIIVASLSLALILHLLRWVFGSENRFFGKEFPYAPYAATCTVLMLFVSRYIP